MDLDLEQDAVEMMELGSLSTAVGGQDGEPVSEEHGGRPAPDCHSLEMGFRAVKAPSLDDIRGVRIDVEKETSTM
jgi:hypothetical protein